MNCLVWSCFDSWSYFTTEIWFSSDHLRSSFPFFPPPNLQIWSETASGGRLRVQSEASHGRVGGARRVSQITSQSGWFLVRYVILCHDMFIYTVIYHSRRCRNHTITSTSIKHTQRYTHIDLYRYIYMYTCHSYVNDVQFCSPFLSILSGSLHRRPSPRRFRSCRRSSPCWRWTSRAFCSWGRRSGAVAQWPNGRCHGASTFEEISYAILRLYLSGWLSWGNS